MSHYEPPIKWNDHEDIAMKLYERFGDDLPSRKPERVRRRCAGRTGGTCLCVRHAAQSGERAQSIN